MRMHATIQHHRKADLGQFLITVVLGLPALFAFCAAAGLAYGSPHSPSGLWFFYLVSRNFGYAGIAVERASPVWRSFGGVFPKRLRV